MGRKSKAKFAMKGHTLPGINQKSETVNIKDGRSPSSAFQMKEAGDSPHKFAGLIGLGVGALARSKWGKNLGKGIGKFAKKAGGALLGGGIGSALGGGGGGSEDAEAGKALLKEEAKEEMQGDSAMAMKSPNKKKLKTSGIRTVVGGEIGPGSTASPHSK